MRDYAPPLAHSAIMFISQSRHLRQTVSSHNLMAIAQMQWALAGASLRRSPAGLVQEVPQRETTPFYPRSPYAVAKLYGAPASLERHPVPLSFPACAWAEQNLPNLPSLSVTSASASS